MNKPTGFIHQDTLGNGENHCVKFIDYRGKDVSFDRWRFNLYYAPNMAMTHFEYSEEKAESFLKENAVSCYSNYADYRSAEQISA